MKGHCFREKVERNLQKLRLNPILPLDTPHVVLQLPNAEGVGEAQAAHAAQR